MPRVKLNIETPLQRLIRGYWSTGCALGDVLGCSAPTARRKMSHPGEITLDDLKALNRHGIPIEDIRNSITF